MTRAQRRPRPPWPLAVACLVLVIEAAALAGMAIAFVLDMVRGQVTALGATAVMTVFFLGLAALLGLSARALFAGQRWGRGPALTWQLLQGAAALSGAMSSPLYLTAGIVAAALIVVVGVVWPSSREHLTEPGQPSRVA